MGTTNGNCGGGIFVLNAGSNVTINQCIIEKNGSFFGGGIFNKNASPTLTNCIFSRNSAVNYGGGMMNEIASLPQLTNCVFTGNYSGIVGGGIANFSGSAMTLTHSTIVNNFGADGGGFYNDNSNSTISNSIIWGNANNGLANFQTTTTVNYSVLQAAHAGTGNSITNPQFANPADPDGTDNQWFTADDGLRLGCASSAFNTGNSSLTTDILGNTRPQLGATDIGAYESAQDITPFAATAAETGVECGAKTLTVTTNPVQTNPTYAWSAGTTPSVAANRVTTSGTYTVTVTNSAGCTATANVAVTVTQPVTRLYVNAANTNPTKDGLTWTTAFDNLQSALSACKTSGAEIWVAKGTYKPSADVTGNGSPADNRKKTFLIPNNVLIYGGFVGNEANLSQRTPSVILANPTLLSGDFNGDDAVSGNGNGLVFTNYTENAYHVVTANSLTGTSRLDGFTITSGNANLADAYFNYGGGVLSLDGGSNFTLANCILTKNRGELGGGMSNVGNAASQIVNCVFEKNYSSLHGGAAMNYLSTPAFSNCVFTGNWAQNVGGVLYNLTTANASLRNCTLIGNAASAASGGAIYNDASFPTISNSIIWANAPTDPFGSWLNGAPTINHSIVQGGHAGTNNTATDPLFTNISDPDGTDNQWFTSDDGLRLACGSPAYNSGTTTTLTTDILNNNRNQLGGVDRGAYESTIDLTAPTITITGTTTACGSVTLTASTTSPLGAGGYAWSGGTTPSVATNTFTSSGTYTVSVTNATGCTATASATVTLTGATRLYVNVENTNTTKDGLSWATAFSDLQSALSACLATNGEIWVAKGTYKPSVDAFGNATPTNNQNKTFYLKGSYKIYGGFAGTETNLSQRTPSVLAANPTILSGDLNNNDVVTGSGVSDFNVTNNSENAHHVVLAAGAGTTGLVDGVIIRGGNASGFDSYTVNGQAIYNNSGGGFYQAGCSVALNNVVFLLNTASFGGGLYCFMASPTVTNCVFDRNRAFTHGAAGANVAFAAPIFSNCVINSGRADGVGAAFYNILNVSPTFTNCTFFNNDAPNTGAVIYNDGSSSTLKNCIIWSNPTTYDFNSINGGTAAVTFSIHQGGTTGTGNSPSNPQFANPSDPDGADNQWFTSDDGLRLACRSSAFNRGTNTEAPTIDIIGNARPQFTTVDMGAYESTTDLTTPNASITINNSICEQTTATASGGATYAWSGGATPSVASNTFTVSGTYTVTVTNANGCTATASQAITVQSIVTPSVSITASPSNNIASGTNVTFTATPTNGGTTPQYQWFLNNNPVGTNSATYSNNSLAHNDEIKCVMTANNTCQTTTTATSNTIKMLICPASATRLYVKPTASGTGDGSSWANATADLQNAINNGCGITEIWVAAGVYNPTQDPSGNTNPINNRDKTFYMKNGVKIYGGFIGTEGSLSARNWVTNPTVLSGDFNNNDVVTGTNGSLSISNNTDNAYHIVLSVADDNTTILDGFTLKGGNADGVGTMTVETKIFGRGNGGGLSLISSNMTVKNCIFKHNKAGIGGGMACFEALSPLLSHTVFEENLASFGGAMFGNTNTISPTNCIFTGNHATVLGGAMYNQSNTIVLNNSTVFNNTIYNEVADFTAKNTIVWGQAITSFNSNARGTNSIVQGGLSGTAMFNSDPFFSHSNDPDGADNQWFTTDDGLQLQNTSPARDAGTNTGAPTLDILGVGIFNTTKDMGAYEFQENIYTGSTACQSISVANVSGNQWFYFRHNNAIIAAINPNGMNLGTVTANISDPTGAISFTNSKFIGRTINFTSSNYADGVTMPSNYTLRLYYADGELTELNQLTGGNANLSDFNMAWQQGTSGCTLSAAANVGIILKNNITTGEYGPNNNGFFLQFPLNHFTVFAPTTSGSQVLPVELLNFSGYTEGGQNLLIWTTANEINNKGFNVERLMDNGQWVRLGFVATKGKAAIYDFTDKAPFSVSYYRLRQIDNDGKETLSKVISLSNTSKSFLKVYPNPTTDVVTVELTKGIDAANKDANFMIINLLGQQILRGQLNQNVDVSNLPSGTYIVRVGLEQVKFVKQ